MIDRVESLSSYMVRVQYSSDADKDRIILIPGDLYFVVFDSKPSNKLNLQSECVGDLAPKHNVAGISVAPSKIQGISSVI